MLADAVVTAIDAGVRTEMDRTRQPGLTLGVTDRDATLAVRTYGLADLAAEEPVTPETLFEIGSIGKSFTAILVLQVAEAGRIDLRAPVAEYVPWFRNGGARRGAPVTVAHLLSHTAGIVAGIDATPEAAFQVWSLRDLPARSAPGERFHYSNVGYKALGLVLEAVEGRPYPELVRARVLDPLGMATTEPAITDDIHARLAVGYEYLRDDRVGYPGAPLVPATWLRTDTADGSIASTAGDMCAYARLLLSGGEGPAGRLLGERTFAQMTMPHVRIDASTGYGYGVMIRELGGRTFIGHGGGMVGYLAAVQADRDAGIAAVVLQNGVGADPMGLARAAIRIVRDGRGPGPRGDAVPPDGAADGAWRALAGVYRPDDDAAQSIELLAAEEGMLLRAGAHDIALERVADDLYLVPDRAFDRFLVRVERPPGRPPELWHGDRRYTRPGAGSPPRAEPCPALRSIAGHYRSHNPWTPSFRVVLRGDRPWLVFAAAPDGFDDEQPLAGSADGAFRVGRDPGNPECLRFDTTVGGRALRAWLSGWPYYRVE